MHPARLFGTSEAAEAAPEAGEAGEHRVDVEAGVRQLQLDRRAQGGESSLQDRAVAIELRLQAVHGARRRVRADQRQQERPAARAQGRLAQDPGRQHELLLAGVRGDLLAERLRYRAVHALDRPVAADVGLGPLRPVQLGIDFRLLVRGQVLHGRHHHGQ